MFADFFLHPAHAGQVLHVQHAPLLVVLSILVAMSASILALQMMQSAAQAAAALVRYLTLFCSAATLGLGVWSMHFIGMLALELPIAVHYDMGLTLVSMLPGVISAGIALHLLLNNKNHLARLIAAGAIVGMGIAAMHYCGMSAMVMDADLRYEPVWFFVSLVISVSLSIFAVVVWSRLTEKMVATHWLGRLAPSVLLGVAIASLHYISMLSTRFVAQNAIPGSVQASESHMLALVVTAGSLGLFIVTGLCVASLRYRSLWQQVQRSEARLQAMANTAVDGVITIDAKGVVQSFNPAAERMFGWQASDVVGQNLHMLMPAPLSDHHDQYLERYQATREKKIIGSGREVLGLHKDGRHIPLRLSIGQADTPDGPLFVGFAYDLSERKRTETQLRIAASVFDHAHEGIAVIDAHQRLWQFNPAFQRMMDLSEIPLAEKPLFESLYAETVPPLNPKEMWQVLAVQGHWQSEFRFHTPSGKSWQQRLSISAVYNEQKRLSHYVAIVSDISYHHLSANLTDTSHLYDPLTKLPNQMLLMERITHMLPSARRHGTLLSVICIDFDHFTRVNQIHGAAIGDELLQKMSARIRTLLREEDTLARGRGDELVVVLSGLKETSGMHTVLARIQAALQSPLELSSVVIQISATIGWSITSLNTVPTTEQLLTGARAMVKDQKTKNLSTASMQGN